MPVGKSAEPRPEYFQAFVYSPFQATQSPTTALNTFSIAPRACPTIRCLHFEPLAALIQKLWHLPVIRYKVLILNNIL